MSHSLPRPGRGGACRKRVAKQTVHVATEERITYNNEWLASQVTSYQLFHTWGHSYHHGASEVSRQGCSSLWKNRS